MADYFNALGAVQLGDGGNPRTVTFKARANISGGYWVLGSSANDVVSSGTDGYAASDIEGYPLGNQVGSNVIGLCLQNTASGTYGVAATRGTYILPAASGTAIGSHYAGWPICAGSMGTAFPLGSMTLLVNTIPGNTTGPFDLKVGRTLSTSSNDGTGFVVATLNI